MSQGRVLPVGSRLSSKATAGGSGLDATQEEKDILLGRLDKHQRGGQTLQHDSATVTGRKSKKLSGRVP